MTKKSFLTLILVFLCVEGVFAPELVLPAQKALERINILAGSTGWCGTHQGEFEAMYQGRKITIEFLYNPNPANPVAHPGMCQ